MGMSLVLQVFSHKPKYWTNWNFHLMEALQEKSEDHQSHLGYIIWEPQMSVQCLCQVDVLDVEIFNWISEAFHPLALHE